MLFTAIKHHLNHDSWLTTWPRLPFPSPGSIKMSTENAPEHSSFRNASDFKRSRKKFKILTTHPWKWLRQSSKEHFLTLDLAIFGLLVPYGQTDLLRNHNRCPGIRNKTITPKEPSRHQWHGLAKGTEVNGCCLVMLFSYILSLRRLGRTAHQRSLHSILKIRASGWDVHAKIFAFQIIYK